MERADGGSGCVLGLTSARGASASPCRIGGRVRVSDRRARAAAGSPPDLQALGELIRRARGHPDRRRAAAAHVGRERPGGRRGPRVRAGARRGHLAAGRAGRRTLHHARGRARPARTPRETAASASKGSVDAWRRPCCCAPISSANAGPRGGRRDEARAADAALGLALALLRRGARRGRALGCLPPPTRPPPRWSSRSRRAQPLGAIARALERAGLVRSASAVEWIARLRGQSGELRVGRVRALGRAERRARSSRGSRAAARSATRSCCPRASPPPRSARGSRQRGSSTRTPSRSAIRDPALDRVARHLRPEPRGLSLPRDLPASARPAGRARSRACSSEQFLAVWRRSSRSPTAQGLASTRS